MKDFRVHLDWIALLNGLGIEYPGETPNEQMDENRAEILNEENGTPGYLRSKVLEYDRIWRR